MFKDTAVYFLGECTSFIEKKIQPNLSKKINKALIMRPWILKFQSCERLFDNYCKKFI